MRIQPPADGRTMSKQDPERKQERSPAAERTRDSDPGTAADGPPFPQAEVRTAAVPTLRPLVQVLSNYWWAVAIALLMIAVSVSVSWWTRGPVIQIRFDEGHGIKPGDALLYRGIHPIYADIDI